MKDPSMEALAGSAASCRRWRRRPCPPHLRPSYSTEQLGPRGWSSAQRRVWGHFERGCSLEDKPLPRLPLKERREAPKAERRGREAAIC